MALALHSPPSPFVGGPFHPPCISWMLGCFALTVLPVLDFGESGILWCAFWAPLAVGWGSGSPVVCAFIYAIFCLDILYPSRAQGLASSACGDKGIPQAHFLFASLLPLLVLVSEKWVYWGKEGRGRDCRVSLDLHPTL